MGTRAQRTFEQFQAYVLEVFKRDDKTEEIKSAINDAFDFISTAHSFQELNRKCYVPSIRGQEDYGLPPNLVEVHHPLRLLVDVGDGQGSSYPMNPITWEEYDRKYPNPNFASRPLGKPRDYTIFQDALHIGPVPDQVDGYYKFELSHNVQFEKLQGASDRHPFNAVWEATIREKVLEILYGTHLKLHDEAGIHAENFMNGIEDPISGERLGGFVRWIAADSGKGIGRHRSVEPRFF